MINYIALAIPFFFLLIGFEVLLTRRTHPEYYRFNDSINDLSTGVTQQVLNIFIKGLLAAGYIYLYAEYRIWEIPLTSTWAWVVCFVGVDFFYYWFHRMSHGINVIWAAHVVHHQSEEYNLTVALRQGALQGAFSWVFYLPLAVLGFPPLMLFTNSSFNTLYQFWIHTRAIGKMGPLEWVINTPSHHRVHHGRNPKYIDKNHAGTFIVWDRLFGTFQVEEEEPVFGITKPLASWNPLWANAHYWVEIWALSKQCRGFDKILAFTKPPGWKPEYLGGFQPAPPIKEQDNRKFDAGRGSPFTPYIMGQFVIIAICVTGLLLLEKNLTLIQEAPLALFIVGGLFLFGALLEARGWASKVEIVRAVSLPLLIAAAGYTAPLHIGIALAISISSIVWLSRIPRQSVVIPLTSGL